MALLASKAILRREVRLPQLGPCELCELGLALPSCVSGLSLVALYVIKTWGRDGSPGGPFFSLLDDPPALIDVRVVAAATAGANSIALTERVNASVAIEKQIERSHVADHEVATWQSVELQRVQGFSRPISG